MDFAFSDEQQMLRDQARSFLADRFPPERVAELSESEQGWDPASLGEMAGLGWTGLSVPETDGGAGMGFLEEAVLFEETGYALYPGPFFSTVGLALPALSGPTLQRVVAGEVAATLAWAEPSTRLSLADLEGLGTKAEGSGDQVTLTGSKHLVPDLQTAGAVVVVARAADGFGLYEVDPSAATVSIDDTVDRSRRLGRLELASVPARVLATGREAAETIERIRLRALAALALEAVGISQKVLELAVAHVSERKQFDKPIGAYQAVSHQVTNIYIDTELARSVAYWAAWCVAEGDEQAPAAVAAAKAAASRTVTACERAIQVHGGIGFTWEHILHRYYKRAQWIDSFEGHSARHRADVARAVLG